MQKEYGGGSSDGFVTHFNDDGSLYAATYYGGTGERPGAGSDNPDLQRIDRVDCGVIRAPGDGLELCPYCAAGSAASIPLVVTGPYNVPASVRVAAGFQTPLNLGEVSLPTPGTISSGDPTTVVLSPDNTKKGSKSVTIPANGQQVWVQGLRTGGNVALTISVPGEPDVSIPVQFIKPEANVYYGNGTLEPLEIAVGEGRQYR